VRGWLLVACACGHAGFDPITTASGDAVPDSAAGAPSLVAMNAVSSSTATVTVPMMIGRGHLVVVIVDTFATGFPVIGVTDGAGVSYVSANAGASFDGGSMDTGATEIWYVADSQPSSGAVTVTLAGDVGSFAWVAEFAGIATSSPLDTVAHTDTANSSTDVSGAAVTTTSPEELVMSVMADDGHVTGLVAGNPFHELPLLEGDDVAYLVAAQAASYAPVWSVDTGVTFCSSTATFRAGP